MYLFKCTVYHILILILILMEKEKPILIEQKIINKKTYLVPQYNLYGCEKYMLPKLDNAPVHHTFFSTKDIEQLYKQKNIDPEDLQCNLKVNLQQRKKSQAFSQTSNKVPESLSNKASVQSQKIKTRPRPKLRETGFTHFIHIPLTQQIGQFFQNQIKPQIDSGDIDTLVDMNQLHATILVFRPKSLDDIPKWQKIVKSVNYKKAKVFIKGVDIFPVKKTFTRVLYLNINGLDDIIDTIVAKAIDQQLIQEKQLSHIYFDKASQTFKCQKQHVTLLKTKGDDLIDAASYLKLFGKVNLGKININKIAMSMIGSFDGKQYFNQFEYEWQ